jgi:hypothetical protein
MPKTNEMGTSLLPFFSEMVDVTETSVTTGRRRSLQVYLLPHEPCAIFGASNKREHAEGQSETHQDEISPPR